jgi:hypothetical protein
MNTTWDAFMSKYPWMEYAPPRLLLEAFYHYIFNGGNMQFIDSFCNNEKERQEQIEKNVRDLFESDN